MDDTSNAGNAGGAGQGTDAGGNAGTGTAPATGGETGTGGSSGGTDTGTANGSGADRGFPDNTPLEQMTVDQREAYWKFYARKHERAAAAAPSAQEIAELRDKAGKYEAHQRAQMTDLEREQARTSELQTKVAGYERAENRRAAAKAAGLSSDDAEWITGDTPEEMQQSAQRLKERLGTAGTAGHATSHDQGTRGGRAGGNQSKAEAGMAEARKRGFVQAAAQTTNT